MKKLWVLGSFVDEYESNLTLSLLSKIAGFKETHGILLEVICLIHPSKQIRIPKTKLSELGVSNLYIWKNHQFEKCHIDCYITLLEKMIKKLKPNYFIILGTSFFSSVAAKLATVLEIGLTAKCSEYQINDSDDIIQIRPTFEGNTYAHIISKSFLKLSTAMPIISEQKNEKKRNENTKIIENEMHIDNIRHYQNIKIKKQIVEKKKKLYEYDVVFAGGMGLKSRENFKKLKELAKKHNAGIAASRPVVEMGWADKSHLIGMSGHCISPKLYIAFGISGSLQHIEGMKDSTKIISINRDKNAPIHNICHYVIVADAARVVEGLIL